MRKCETVSEPNADARAVPTRMRAPRLMTRMPTRMRDPRLMTRMPTRMREARR